LLSYLFPLNLDVYCLSFSLTPFSIDFSTTKALVLRLLLEPT
jgi:hypothetical protein